MVAKEELIRSMVASGALKSKPVIAAFRKVRRENFVQPEYVDQAYDDRPLPIMQGQTISQPTTVAIMTEALDLRPGQKVLEVGTGSGYQAAIIAEILGPNGRLLTVELRPDLAQFAERNLELSGYKNVKVTIGDGSLGVKGEAPFDRIIVTAGSPKIPEALKEQLKVGGKMVIPVGPEFQQDMLLVTKKGKNEFHTENLGPFVFVPLIGKQGWKEPR
jgi:protein-L-isoaspartate(D-aspartate) O-methyltransferase